MADVAPSTTILTDAPAARTTTRTRGRGGPRTPPAAETTARTSPRTCARPSRDRARPRPPSPALPAGQAERTSPRPDWAGRARTCGELLGGVVRRVEDAHRQGVDRGHVHRNRSLSARGVDRARRVVAAEEDSALHAGENIHPRHRVLEFGVALLRESEKLVHPG